MTTPLIDGFGRVHRDLRISVTDRCNFRCGYCMPAEGLRWLPRDDLLTFEEIERVARLLVERYGVGGIRLTPAASPPFGPSFRCWWANWPTSASTWP